MTEEGARLADAIHPLFPLIAEALENFKENAPELDASQFEPAEERTAGSTGNA